MKWNRKIRRAGLAAIACAAGVLVLRPPVPNRGLELRMAANAGDLGRVEQLLRLYPNLIDLRDTRGLRRTEQSRSNAPQGRLLIRELFSKYTLNEFRGLLDEDSEGLDSHGPILTCSFGLAEENGATALHQAVYARHPEVVEYLCERGADPNITDQVGATPLMVAVWTEQDQMVEMLLSAGAKLAPDNSGVSPLDHANLRRNEKIVGLLQAAHQRERGVGNSASVRFEAAGNSRTMCSTEQPPALAVSIGVGLRLSRLHFNACRQVAAYIGRWAEKMSQRAHRVIDSSCADSLEDRIVSISFLFR